MVKAITLLTQIIQPKKIYNEVSKREHVHRLSFITLTISDPTMLLTGKEAYQKLLSHFLQWLRRTKKVKTYLWKAELQQNGQIHYHITTTSFVNYQEIRDTWNNLQRRNGLLESYHKLKGHYDANSTDVHEVRKIEDMAGYLIKEIVKSCQNKTALGGKVWDCSENLKSNSYFSVELKDDHKKFFDLAEENELTATFTSLRFSIIKFKEPPEEWLLSKKEFEEFEKHKENIRGYKREKCAKLNLVVT